MVAVSLKENEILFIRDVFSRSKWNTPFEAELAKDIETKFKKSTSKK